MAGPVGVIWARPRVPLLGTLGRAGEAVCWCPCRLQGAGPVSLTPLLEPLGPGPLGMQSCLGHHAARGGGRAERVHSIRDPVTEDLLACKSAWFSPHSPPSQHLPNTNGHFPVPFPGVTGLKAPSPHLRDNPTARISTGFPPCRLLPVVSLPVSLSVSLPVSLSPCLCLCLPVCGTLSSLWLLSPLLLLFLSSLQISLRLSVYDICVQGIPNVTLQPHSCKRLWLDRPRQPPRDLRGQVTPRPPARTLVSLPSCADPESHAGDWLFLLVCVPAINRSVGPLWGLSVPQSWPLRPALAAIVCNLPKASLHSVSPTTCHHREATVVSDTRHPGHGPLPASVSSSCAQSRR